MNKFIIYLLKNDKETILLRSKDKLIADDFDDLNSPAFGYDEKYLANDLERTPTAKSKSFKVMSELLTTTSIKNVFEGNLIEAENKSPQDDMAVDANFEELGNINVEHGLINKNIISLSEKLLDDSKIKMLNFELQQLISE